jgi:predicted peroxiredoxin
MPVNFFTSAVAARKCSDHCRGIAAFSVPTAMFPVPRYSSLAKAKALEVVMKRTAYLLFIILLFVFPTQVVAENGKTFLIHAKTSLKLDDAQICAVPNVAWAAHQEGYKVVILFDASGVTAIKKGGIFGGDKSPLDKAALPERERQTLVNQLGVPLENVPRDYGEYIRFLGQKGIELYANQTMMLLYKIDKNEIEQAVTPIGLKKMVELLEKRDVYVAY